MKKHLSILLCLMLLVGLLPAQVSAAPDTEPCTCHDQLPGIVVQNQTTVIEVVDLTIETPMIGNTPWYNPPITTEGCQLHTVDPVDWIDKTENRYMTPGEKFKEGHVYEVQVWVDALEDYEFHVDAYDNIHTKGRINGQEVTVSKARGYDPSRVIRISWEYGELVRIHQCALTLVPRQEATCTQDGHEAYFHCSCGLNYADARGETVVDINTWGILPATGHRPSGWRTTQVYHYRVCTTCGDFLEQEDHYGGEATCTEKAKCTVCGYAYGAAEPDHRWGPGWDFKNAYGHAWICADCREHSEVMPHTPGPAATETSPQICTACGYIIEPAKNHTHELLKVPQVPADCIYEGNIEYYYCVGCNDCFTDPQAKNKIPETMSVMVPALGHTVSDTWSHNSEYHWRTCSRCQVILDETRMLHENVNGKCATCGRPMADVNGPGETTGATGPEESQPEESKAADSLLSGGKTFQWEVAVMLGLVCFGLAVTVSVLILKGKKK